MRFRFLTIPMARRVFMLILALGIGSICAFGTTYYVATTGSDSNPGNATLPFLTIQHAANLVNPGDTVIVNDGVYSGTCNSSNPDNCTLVEISRGGTSGAYVTFEAQNKWGAVLDGNNFAIGFAWDTAGSNVHHVRIQGFEIRNFATSGFQSFRGAQFIDFVGNHLHNIGNFCTGSGEGRSGIFLGDSNVTIEQNLIHDVWRLSVGQNGCTQNGNPNFNGDQGIYADAEGATQTGVVIKNNIFYNIPMGFGVQFYSGSGGTVSNSSVVNNTFAFANQHNYAGQIIIDENLTNVNIENNIFYQAQNAGILYYGNGLTYSGVKIENNLSSNGLLSNGDGGSTSGLTINGNLLNKNPEFIDASAENFYLLSTSPSIDAGLTISSVTNDYAGTPRPQGAAYDIGAFEFKTASAPRISSFTANPTVISPGGSSTLSWLVLGATSLSIDQGVGNVTGQSSVGINPLQTTTYTLTATNPYGTATARVTVTINSGCTQ